MKFCWECEEYHTGACGICTLCKKKDCKCDDEFESERENAVV